MPAIQDDGAGEDAGAADVKQEVPETETGAGAGADAGAAATAGEPTEGVGGVEPDKKPDIKRAPPIAFYDPKMPRMPEKLPFPDEGMMRRGALGALAVGQGITFAPVMASDAAAAADAEEAAVADDMQEMTEEAREEMKRNAEEVRRRQEAEEADAFDLDLN